MDIVDNRSFINKEDEKTIENELKLAERVESKWGAEFKKMHSTYALDFAIIKNGKIKAWAECKTRYHKYGTFFTYMMSLKKYRACRDYTIKTGLKSFFLVAYEDGDWFIDTRTIAQNIKKFTINIGGTEKRGLGIDYEPMIFVPLFLFKKL